MRPTDAHVRHALAVMLHDRHLGRARAATWADISAELLREGFAAHEVRPRRLQECAEHLLCEGVPVVGLSADGVWWAETADEIETAWREVDRRARQMLRRRRRLRRVWLEMRGQERLRGVA